MGLFILNTQICKPIKYRYAKEHDSAPFKVDSDKMINMSPKDDSSESNENFFIDMEPSGSNISASQKKKYGLDQLNLNSTN